LLGEVFSYFRQVEGYNALPQCNGEIVELAIHLFVIVGHGSGYVVRIDEDDVEPLMHLPK
jgi:hypothetical protein